MNMLGSLGSPQGQRRAQSLEERAWGRSVRSVFKISKLFLRPRPWQFEVRDSTDE